MEFDQISSSADNHQVYMNGFTFAGRGLGVRVTFSLNRIGKNIHWDQSKRLVTGSLVVLMAANDVSVCKVAIVAARPLSGLEKNPPEIHLFFGRTEDLEVDSQREWIMIEERSGFFEAERHTLLALQKMMLEK